MYRHILIPTDGSELAEHAVTNGLSLAKSVGAKVTVIIAEEPFDWLGVSETKAQRALEELAKYTEQIKKHAASVLNRVANADLADHGMSALPPKADMCSALTHVRFVPIADICLFDHLVGEQQERLAYREAERLGRLEVDDEFKLGR